MHIFGLKVETGALSENTDLNWKKKHANFTRVIPARRQFCTFWLRGSMPPLTEYYILNVSTLKKIPNVSLIEGNNWANTVKSCWNQREKSRVKIVSTDLSDAFLGVLILIITSWGSAALSIHSLVPSTGTALLASVASVCQVRIWHPSVSSLQKSLMVSLV